MTHVALCFTDPLGIYYKHALVTALSVLDNCKGRLCLHIVHDETLSPAAQETFKDICRQYGQDIQFYHANNIPQETIDNVPPFLGKGTLYKTMLPNLLSAEKALYLDCDIICLADVSEIFAIDVSGVYLGAVKMDKIQGSNWRRRLELTSDFCINAGVLLMNLKKIREDIPDYAARLFEIGGKAKVKVGDQGATNLLFDKMPGAYRFLPEFCNLRTEQGDNSVWPMADYRGHVIHFAGKKPWETLTTPGLYYWKYYSRLFPSEDVFARLEKLEPYGFDYLYAFMLRDGKRWRKLRREYDRESIGLWQTIKKRLFR